MKKYIIPSILFLAFLLVGILTLSDYGMNWDSPIHYLRGQAYAHLYLTGEKSFSLPQHLSPLIIKPGEIASRYYFIPEERWKIIGPLPPRPQFRAEFDKIQKSYGDLSFYQDNDWGGEYWIKYDQPHLPFIDILASFSNRFFWGKLGWLSDLESYQLVYVLISAAGVFIVSLFAFEITQSYLASLVAGLSLGLFPIYFAESHFNMKDPEQAVFFLGAVWAFWRWVKEGRLGKLGGLGRFGVFIMFIALALGTKWNIIFLPFILIPWLILIKFKEWGRLGKLGILGGLGIVLFLIAIWPHSWGEPVGSFIETVRFYFHTGVGKTLIQPVGFVLPGGFNVYPLILFFAQTPEIILLLGGMGVIGVIRERGGKLKIGYLLLIWLAVPAIRLSFPGAWSYGGWRQIMEIIPAMAILAGMGVNYLAKKLQNNIIIITIIIIIIVILLFPIARLHPNENAYFNNLVGGLKGAADKNLVDWTITYGNIYKQAIEWINNHADKNANIAHLAGSDYAISPFYLRDDISLSPYHFSGFEQKGEYILSLYNPLNTPVFAKRYPEKFLKPVHEIKIGGISLLNIFKNESKFNKLNISKEKILSNIIVQPKSEERGDYWEIKLDKDYLITRIYVENMSGCDKTMTYSNELIFFIPASKINVELNPAEAFILNEKKDLGKGITEYDFPAEDAKIVRIYPLNNKSCFGNGKIIKILGI